MSLDSYTITVTDVAQMIVDAPAGVGRCKAYFSNLSQTDDIYIGDKNVTATTGLVLHKNASNAGNRIEIEMFSHDELWAICASAKTAVLAIIQVGDN